MTPRQSEIFMMVEEFWKKYGYSPSIDEIMRLTNNKSRSNVSRVINDLCKIGALKKMPNRKRTLRPAYAKYRNLCDEAI